jgi:AraC family transcriptional regulator of adaptative response/methylated-DNA-[protein]-cysteine methyltransferase
METDPKPIALTSRTANTDQAARDQRRWNAINARDPAADPDFVYGVKTTGVYCRPGSAARLPKRENVVFFDSAAAAEAAGYRPSRRVGADPVEAAGQRAQMVADVCRLIEQAETEPNLEALAAKVGLSVFHFHRVFKAETGLTPREYALSLRARRLRGELQSAASVTEAIYAAGFNSNSRFYEASNALLGMHARDYRDGGKDVEIKFGVGQCSLGAILVAESPRGICSILLGDDPNALVQDLQVQFRKARIIGGDAAFEQRMAEVIGFIEQPRLGLNLPLDIRGTAFQARVWNALREIPVGETVSYAEIARRIGQPESVRAVAQACGANALAVAIPCHRVVRKDGGLSGYRWGVDRKRALLVREGNSGSR